MEYRDYIALKERIVPRLRFNQAIYEDAVAQHVSEQTVWLDAGCGLHILPRWREEVERQLVTKARLAVGCDIDQASLSKHSSLRHLVAGDLERLPLRTGTVSLLTCNMVVEHLRRPHAVFAEFSRVLKIRGRLIVHTPNAYSHFVIGSRLVPRSLRLKLTQALDCRAGEEVFPTRYRANTPRTLRELMSQVGLKEEWSRMLASDATLALTHPLLAALELFYIRLTLRPAFKLLRPSILASFVKSSNPQP